jgi:hypothetical protein
MAPETVDICAILKRLDKLERQSRIIKWFAIWTLLLVTLFSIQCASPSGISHDTIEAHRFVVLCKDGKTCGELSAYNDAALMFYDKKGTEQMTLDPEHIAFFDPSQPTGTRAGVFIQDLNGEPLIWLAKNNRIIWQVPRD